jgi:tetratricopeptide (TPR) repeat protein
MGLKRALRSSVAAICIAAVAAPAGLAAPAAKVASAPGLEVRVARAKTFSRVEFRGGGRPTIAREHGAVVLTFGRGLDPDLARLRTSPPPWIKAAEARSAGGRLQIVLTLTDDADASFGTADGAVYVNAFAKPAPAAEAAAPAVQAAAAPPPEPEPARPNPVPAGGVVHMTARIANGQVVFTFPWANPNGAAVFRRGDAVWMVFDAGAAIDVSQAPRGLTQFSTMEAVRGADYAAVRIAARPGIPVSVASQGGVWTLSLGAGRQDPPGLVRLTRDDSGGPAALKAPLAGATRIVRLADPYVRDEVSVVTALGPAKGLPSRREFVQMAFLPSVHGLAIESYIDDLSVTHDDDLVYVGRPKGLALSPAWAIDEKPAADVGAPKPAAMPALIDYANWPKTGTGGFLARYNALFAAAADEQAKGRDAPVEARMAFARFLVGSELSFEAIGVLNGVARVRPQTMDQPEFRGLRGVARVMARRYKEAEADFSSPVLADDPSSALWRAYIDAQLARWTEARQQFDAGAEAFSYFSPVWKARFARSDAEAALALGDLVGAKERIDLALSDKTDPAEELSTRLVQARVVEAQGSTARALRIYQVLTRAPMESVSTPAMLRATQIRLETGKITAAQAVQVFDGLRYRWRGDGAELEIIRVLGHLYLTQGRYREALEALRSAGRRLPDRPEALALQTDLATAFRGLFLDGTADGLEPIQALALFYDFKELTPIGADGDLMVRKLVRRLVDVDLLDQAADLLRYQVDNRLDGVPRAQVATDLAVIYLMDRQPEKALEAINGSRTTVLPSALNAERRLIEARAWTGLGRYENALEILGKDVSPSGQELRSEITWKQKDWPAAGASFEKALGDRWKAGGALSSEDEGRLLRAGVAYSLAGDGVSLARLQDRYKGYYDLAHNPEALRVALSGLPSGRLTVADFGRATADSEVFAGWVAKMKQRFRQGAATPPAPLKQAAAAPAPPAKG